MRLFVAVDPPADAVADLAALTRGLHVATVRPEQWHVTVAFLGDVEEVAVPGVEAAVARAAGGARRGRVRIAGGGQFGRSILWAGIGGDVDGLHRLAAAVRAELSSVGIDCDERPFHPHLTVARLRGRRSPQDLAALAAYEGPEWPLDDVRLIRSWLGTTGEYEVLRAWPPGG
jgi:2'-5' RNA ligase